MGADPAPEEQFGPYLVYERLGVGGMATVHRAREHGPDGRERVVALKRLLPHLAEDASFIKSFVREAKLASMLNHVHIVEIYELGRVGTEYFISMEYIDGRDVRQVLRHARKVTGPPPIHITLALMLQLCDALDYAHHKTDDHGVPLGIVHRDVSPSNLLVTSAGHLKVIDFGIAKAESSQLRTQTGRVKGKLAYMAPEALAGGRDLDARSDIWAAGVILHELLTARPLFASKNEYQTLLKVQRGDIIPPSTYNPSCPHDVDAIVMKALERDPEHRYAHAADMRDELLELRDRLQLSTGFRDISAWIAKAFATEVASDATTGPAAARAHTPQPVRTADDDEAVDLVWGGSDIHGSGPVELPDVPDVSGKVVMRAETEVNDDDDLPTPLPTHGDGELLRTRSRDSEPPPPRRATSTATTTPEGEPLPSTDEPTTDPMAAPLDDDLDAATIAQVASAEPEPEPEAPPAVPAYRNKTPSVPVVRFNRPSTSPPPRTTNPGFGAVTPPRAPATKSVPPGTGTTLVGEPERKRRSSQVSSQLQVGAALIERRKPSRTVLYVLGAVVLATIVVTLAVILLHGDRSEKAATSATPTAPPEPPAAPAKLKFVIEPQDAEVRIDGKQAHVGSPWTIDLAAGEHPVEVRRSGYKSWLTSLELSPGESQLVRVELAPLGGTASSGDATLAISTNPPGLEAWLDGHALAGNTPLKLSIKVGQHVVAVRQNGVEVWHQSFHAEPSSDYEFNPSFTEAKQRERAREPAPVPLPDAAVAPAPAPTASPPPDAAEPPKPAVVETPKPAPLPPPPPPPPAPAPHVTGPVLVAPSAVTKLSGNTPSLVVKNTDLPPVAVAKLCIDTAGKVTSADMVSKIDQQAASELVDTLRGWRYAPYKQGGLAMAACFTVSFRLR